MLSWNPYRAPFTARLGSVLAPRKRRGSPPRDPRCVDVGRCTVPSAVRYSIIDAKLSCTYYSTGKLLLNADSNESMAHRT